MTKKQFPPGMPPRTKAAHAKAQRILREYVDNETFLEANEKVVKAAQVQRQRLAEKFVRVWGMGVAEFEGVRFVPVLHSGKPVLKTFRVHPGGRVL